MAALRKPLDLTAERIAALLDLDPSTETGWRWRMRSLSEFNGDERMCAVWNAKYAGRPAGSRQGEGGQRGRPVLGIDGKTYDPRRLIEELGGAEPTSSSLAAPSSGLPDDRFAMRATAMAETGVLASVIRDAARATGLSRDDLTVLAVKNDPYRRDTPKGHRLGRWFAEHFRQLLLSSTARIHLRGFHYVLVSRGDVEKPDGVGYENSDDDFNWLANEAAKAARWLGYVEFDRIVDNRNAAPVIHRYRHTDAPAASVVASLDDWANEWSRDLGGDIEIGDCQPSAVLSNFGAEQPYCFAFFGEKSSLEDVLDPIAQRIRANMYLCAGEMTDTLIYEMARDAAADGRKLIVFTFSDFDPAGWQMPISIARKLQALRDLKFPDLRAQVVPVSLTLSQVLDLGLPTTPVKQGDNRRDRWDEAFGPALREAGLVADDEPAQVEIDALAAIRPDDLRRITEEKIALYWGRDARPADGRRQGAVGSGGSGRGGRPRRRRPPCRDQAGGGGRRHRLQHGAGERRRGAGPPARRQRRSRRSVRRDQRVRAARTTRT
jgi:hypothetical protein